MACCAAPTAGGAKKAAERGPVYITDRGVLAHVLLTYHAYEQLVGKHRVLEMLAQPAGVADIEFEAPRSGDVPTPAAFE